MLQQKLPSPSPCLFDFQEELYGKCLWSIAGTGDITQNFLTAVSTSFFHKYQNSQFLNGKNEFQPDRCGTNTFLLLNIKTQCHTSLLKPLTRKVSQATLIKGRTYFRPLVHRLKHSPIPNITYIISSQVEQHWKSSKKSDTHKLFRSIYVFLI